MVMGLSGKPMKTASVVSKEMVPALYHKLLRLKAGHVQGHCICNSFFPLYITRSARCLHALAVCCCLYTSPDHSELLPCCRATRSGGRLPVAPPQLQLPKGVPFSCIPVADVYHMGCSQLHMHCLLTTQVWILGSSATTLLMRWGGSMH